MAGFWRELPLTRTGQPPYCVSLRPFLRAVQRQSELSGVIRTLIRSGQGPTLRTSISSNHFLRSASPDTPWARPHMKRGIQTFSPSQEESGLLSGSASTSLMCLCAQSCPTHCGHVDCSPPGSSVHGILQARIVGWVAISSSRGYSQPRDQTLGSVSCMFCVERQILYH